MSTTQLPSQLDPSKPQEVFNATRTAVAMAEAVTTVQADAVSGDKPSPDAGKKQNVVHVEPAANATGKPTEPCDDDDSEDEIDIRELMRLAGCVARGSNTHAAGLNKVGSMEIPKAATTDDNVSEREKNANDTKEANVAGASATEAYVPK